MLNIAMISKWHVHAKMYAKQIESFPNAKITCVWDEDAGRGQAWADELGVPFAPDYDDLLQRNDVDAVVVCSPTDMHPELMIKAADAKKHIFTEKVVALTKKDALLVKEAVERNKINFVISFPQRTKPEHLFAKKAVEDGLLGDVTMARVRNGHNGASANWLPQYWYDPKTTGGGAMMDLGAHPVYLLNWLLGKPKSVQMSAAWYTNRQVEDSAACNIVYQNGAVAVAESSLCAFASPYIMEIYGTKGVLFIRGGNVLLKTEDQDWVTPELPPERPSALSQFISACENGTSAEFGIDDAIALTEVMEGAYISLDTGKTYEF